MPAANCVQHSVPKTEGKGDKVPAVTHQTDYKGILAEQSGVCSCPELPEMVVVVEEKRVVLPLEWQVEGGLQGGQTGQVEEVEHHNQNLKGQNR